MILDEIVAAKRLRLEQHKQQAAPEAMKELALAVREVNQAKETFYEALIKPGLSIIGEFKKASPSMGVIDNRMDLRERIGQYNQAMDAISCLTEEDYFHGDTEIFRTIRSMSALPMIRKDFIIDPYQIYEAKVIGAQAVLLIAAILEDEALSAFYELAGALGLEVLLEVHDERELERALKLKARIIGINNRNLKDFTISLETTGRLAAMVPDEQVLVSESGIITEEDVRYLKGCNVDGVLVGRALMESEDPCGIGRRWKELYREA